jgi:hypothetical protein
MLYFSCEVRSLELHLHRFCKIRFRERAAQSQEQTLLESVSALFGYNWEHILTGVLGCRISKSQIANASEVRSLH